MPTLSKSCNFHLILKALSINTLCNTLVLCEVSRVWVNSFSHIVVSHPTLVPRFINLCYIPLSCMCSLYAQLSPSSEYDLVYYNTTVYSTHHFLTQSMTAHSTWHFGHPFSHRTMRIMKRSVSRQMLWGIVALFLSWYSNTAQQLNL